MATHYRVGFASAWVLAATLAMSCGGASTKSAPDTAVSGSSQGDAAGTGGTPSAGAPAQDGGVPNTTPNTDRCVMNTPCSVEGSECTDDSGCCVIRNGCRSGRWTQTEYLGPCKTDPPAPAFECASQPPAEGTACGPCPLECHYDTCSPEGGKDLIVQCVDGKWNYADLGCLTCCQGDSDCPAGMCVRSRCQSIEHGTGCFRDSECPTGQLCSGAQMAPCGTARAWFDEPGVCIPAGLGCCATNDDCNSGEVCLAGVCKPPAPAGNCWTNADCGFLSCGPRTVCPCGSSCKAPDAPGQCLVAL